MKNGRDLDRACPIDVVEALTEDELLQLRFLDSTGVVDDFVVIGNSGTFVGLLAHYVEIVIVADQALTNQSASLYVTGL